MQFFFHACPSTHPLAIITELFTLGHQHSPPSCTCFVLHSAQYSQRSLLFLYTWIVWPSSQPLSFFSISSFKNNCYMWFYNMQSTFRYMHCLIWRAFPLR
jgi:hypothetical protein